MAVCPNCSESIPEGLSVCPKCEADLPQRKSRGVNFVLIGGVLLAGLVIYLVWIRPEMETSRIAAQMMESRNHLDSMGMALMGYHGQTGAFPAGGSVDDGGQVLHGWQTPLLPFLEQAALYDAIDLAQPWDAPANVASFQKMIPDFLNPALGTESADAEGFALSHYAANSQVFREGEPFRAEEMTDGPADTILAGEVAENFSPWGKPNNVRDPQRGINRSPDGFGGVIGGAGFLFGDGHVRRLHDNIDPEVLKAISTPAGGEAVGDF